MFGLQWSRGLSTAEGGTPIFRWLSSIAVLQWSRGLSTAEGQHLARYVATEDKVLQWSRGLSTAEGGPSSRSASQPSRFNGAAVFRPRRESVPVFYGRP